MSGRLCKKGLHGEQEERGRLSGAIPRGFFSNCESALNVQAIFVYNDPPC